jgi:predicted ribosome quality control (RQC) complex YloA/Tae2 family protein
MNYFNYFTEIEDTFVRRRGKHLLLSPIDWAMIDTWQERGIPLHIALRGIEAVFDNFDKNPGPRSIKSLMFCREEVEAQYQEWLTSQAGRSSDEPAAAAPEGLSQENIERHIDTLIEELGEINVAELAEDLERAASRLSQLREELTPDLETVDRSLLDIEKFLDEALLARINKDELKRAGKEVAGQLREYKSGMEKEAYEQTYRLMLLKKLREDAGVPRMGLFYL